jgi:hypothetical protein
MVRKSAFDTGFSKEGVSKLCHMRLFAKFTKLAFSPDICVLTAFAAGTNLVVHAAEVTTVHMQTKSFEFSVVFQNTQPNLGVCFNLYGFYKNADVGAWPAYHHIGSAFVSFNDLLEKEGRKASFNSSATKDIAEMTVSMKFASLSDSDTPAEPTEILYESPSILKIGNRAMEALCRRHLQSVEHLSYNPRFMKDHGFNPLFAVINIRGEQMSTAAFLASLCTIRVCTEDYAKQLAWWMKIARANLGIAPDKNLRELYEEDAPEVNQLVSEIMTMPMKGLIYAHDSVKVDGVFEDEDQWTPIAMFPDIAHACFDCEDGMITVCELLNAFRDINLKSAKKCVSASELESLLFLQSLLKKYEVCFALGQLRCGGRRDNPKYVLHAFPMLIDKKWFTQEPGDRLDTILLETTNDLRTDYGHLKDAKRINEENVEAQNYDDGDTFFDVAAMKAGNVDEELDSFWRFVVHLKAPVARIRSERIFGLLHCVYVPTYKVDGDQVVFEHIKQYHAVNSKGQIGADISALLGLSPKEGFKFVCDFTLTADEMESIRPVMCQNSPIHMPALPASMLENVPTLDKTKYWRFFVKKVDDDEIDTIRNFSKEFLGGGVEVKPTEIELFRDCKMDIFDIPMNHAFRFK